MFAVRRGLFFFVCVAACGGDEAASTPVAPAPRPVAIESADICDESAPLALQLDPPRVFVAPGASRPFRVVVDPDVCTKVSFDFAVDGAGIVEAPAARVLERSPELAAAVKATSAGRTKVTVTARRTSDGSTAKAELDVVVREAKVPGCDAGVTNAKLTGATPAVTHGGARVAVGASAFSRTDELVMPETPMEVSCEPDIVRGAKPLGPAVSFRGPPERMAKPFRRELSFVVPIEPAAMPERARLRHLHVFYKGPRAKSARPVAVTGARIVETDGGYGLAFQSPWLGTYQAAVDDDAGGRTVKRRATHRAMLGISMGAGGVATFGMRHSELFDSVAMLGGPIDWNWLLWFVDQHALSGFCAKGDAACASAPRVAPNMRPLDEPFVHTMDFEHMWNESGSGGGGIARREYISMLSDLSMVRGNPVGQNANPALGMFAAGPKPNDPWVIGAPNPGEIDCSVTVRPIPKSKDESAQREREARCDASRCDPSRRYVVESGYFDDEFNPDGTERVISFCDGSSAKGAASPYMGTWAPPVPGEMMPVSFALAVDLNRNGVRDQGEPVIRASHEPFDDVGTDGVPNALEPGYDPLTNPDPNQDDYDPQINPTGTEGDHRWEPGEPFRDVGLDGVADTKTRSAVGDIGEGDGLFTEAAGLAAYRAIDPSALLRGFGKNAAGVAPSDEELARLRVWTDGGVRDFLNFGRVGDHFHGALSTRLGRAPRGSTFFSEFESLPGQEGLDIGKVDALYTRWADMPRVVGVRYGDVDASAQKIAGGDGQHVGSGGQILARLGAAFAFVGHGWPDADRGQTEASSARPAQTTTGPLGLDCEVSGSCTTDFTGPKSGRTAPVTVILPPGYGHEGNQQKRYPVVYVMHGYGQQESDVSALAILTLISMNESRRSSAHRLPKFIVVYVDGRCRVTNGKPECIAGTFYLDSPRESGPKVETWTEELVAWVDKSFRTLGPAEIDDVP